ncbi:MAG TPA: retroviral-like aspartic protease family protein [Rhizomicrobium sp.]
MDSHSHLTVETFVNNKGPYRFIVDTGADRTVIADNVAAELGLSAGDEVIVQGISSAIPAPSVRLHRLEVGPIAVNDLQAPVLKRNPLGADGYLGLDVIDGKSVTFDFHRQRIAVNTGTPVDPRDTSVIHDHVVRVKGSAGRLVAVNCRVDDARAYAFIDSGAEMSIANTRLFADMQKSGAKYFSDAVVPIMGVTGGSAGGRLTFVDHIRFGSVTFNNSFLLIADLRVFDLWGLADEPALLIGMNFLRATSSVTIDYSLKEVLFRLADLRVASRA